MKPLLFAAIAVLSVMAAFASGSDQKAAYEPREGDVLFQSFPRGDLTDTIEGVTESPLSHCGLLSRTDSGWIVIEAVQPVKETPLAEWIARGRDGGRYLAYRLKEPYLDKIPAFVTAARAFIGRPYDMRYEFDDRKIYCSELIYKSFLRAGGGKLGRLQALSELNWKPHEMHIRQLEGGGLPLDRKMITPRAISEAEQLKKVYEGR